MSFEDGAEMPHQINFNLFDHEYAIRGKWINVTMFYPLVYGDGEELHLVNETIDITVFATPEKSVNEDMNFFGVSPGPATLANFTFFHLYGEKHEVPINHYKFEVGLAYGADRRYDNWSYDSKLIINEAESSSDKANFTKVGTRFPISNSLIKNNINIVASPDDFMASTNTTVNILIGINSLRAVMVDNSILYQSETYEQKSTYIDMSVQGLHIPKKVPLPDQANAEVDSLLVYLERYYLDFECKSISFRKNFLPQVFQDWYCACDENTVDFMPKVALGISSVDNDFYEFEDRDYFLYPYYGPGAKPGTCQLALREDDVKNYILGQVFVKKYQLIFEYSVDHLMIEGQSIPLYFVDIKSVQPSQAEDKLYYSLTIAFIIVSIVLIIHKLTKIRTTRFENQTKMLKHIEQNLMLQNAFTPSQLENHTKEMENHIFRNMRLDQSMNVQMYEMQKARQQIGKTAQMILGSPRRREVEDNNTRFMRRKTIDYRKFQKEI